MKITFKFLIIFAVVVALLAAIFFLLDFRVMTSSASTNSTVAASHGGEGAPQSIQPDTTGLYVQGDGLAPVLQRQLVQTLQFQQHIGQVTAIETPANQANMPQLYVRLTPKQYFWTPVYAQVEYEISVSYGSNGDVSFRDQETPYFKFSSGEPALKFQENLTLRDRSTGLMSAPGYKHYLAEQVAQHILQTLQQEYNR